MEPFFFFCTFININFFLPQFETENWWYLYIFPTKWQANATLNYCYGISWHFFFLSCSSATCYPTKCFLCTRNTTWQTVSLFWQHSDTALYLKFCINKEINLHIIKLSRLSYSGLSLVKTVSRRESMFLLWGKKSSPPSILKKENNNCEKLSEYKNDASQRPSVQREDSYYHFGLWWNLASFSFLVQNKFWFSKIFYWMKQTDSKEMTFVKFSLFHIPSGL